VCDGVCEIIIDLLVPVTTHRRRCIMGSLYKRGGTWWMKYYVNGKPVRKSTGTKKRMIAKEILKKEVLGVELSKISGGSIEDVIFDDIVEVFLRDYRINNKKSLMRAEISSKNLLAEFNEILVSKITTSMIDMYIDKRMKSSCGSCNENFVGRDVCLYCGSENVKNGVVSATVNRELSALKRMFKLGAENTPPLVGNIPKINMLKENNIRTGFFEHGEFLEVRSQLPDYLKPVITFAYKSGCRLEEILGLTWGKVDRANGYVRLESGDTKTGEARSIYFDAELKVMFDGLWNDRKAGPQVEGYVFLNRKTTDRIYRISRPWQTACKKAGVDRLFHDLRRTTVRNMVRAGVSEAVAMKISGHKTRSVFDRYNIVNDNDLKKAVEQQASYLMAQAGHVAGT